MKSFVDFLAEDAAEDIVRILRGAEEIRLDPDPMRRPKKKEEKKPESKKKEEPKAGPLKITVDPRLKGTAKAPKDDSEAEFDRNLAFGNNDRRKRIERNLVLDPAAQPSISVIKT